ncbi:MAG: flagellar biosynthetic protein FliR, partial [Pseudomonadota bacterium]
FALQLAGSMAAQATSVAQIFGAGATPDPLPAIGNVLTLAGIALALAAGLHIKAVAAIMTSYEVLPFGVFPVAGDLGQWGLARAASAFALAFSLAAPFVVAALVYNVALGAINRAMPQLMVAFVGAPAITAGAVFLLFAAGPVALQHWAGRLDVALAAPFATP